MQKSKHLEKNENVVSKWQNFEKKYVDNSEKSNTFTKYLKCDKYVQTYSNRQGKPYPYGVMSLD